MWSDDQRRAAIAAARRAIEARVAGRRAPGRELVDLPHASGVFVTVKVRLHDFTTHTRSTTLPAPTDSGRTVTRLARRLLTEVDTTGGVRLLGVGVSGLADWIQEDLFGEEEQEVEAVPDELVDRVTRGRRWAPGMDVVHDELGRGWVWGSGLGRVTVRSCQPSRRAASRNASKSRSTGTATVLDAVAVKPSACSPGARSPRASS